MADDLHAERAARVLRAARSRLTPHADEDPTATIALLAGAIVVTARRRRQKRALVACASVAMSAAAILMFWTLRARQPHPLSPGLGTVAVSTHQPPPPRSPLTVESLGAGRFIGGAGVRAVLPGGALSQGDILETDAVGVALRSPDGTRLVAGPHTDLVFAHDGGIRWFRLGRGELALEIAKLSPGERLVVETPDREVEVRGTRFKIQLVAHDTCAAGTVTRVEVTQGVVTVREKDGAEEFVKAGESWPPHCAENDAPKAGSNRHAPKAHRDQTRSSPALPATSPSPAPHPVPAASTLAIENDLFGAAIRAERLGDQNGALRALDQLLVRYPASPLRDAASAERLKLIAGHPQEGGPAAAP